MKSADVRRQVQTKRKQLSQELNLTWSAEIAHRFRQSVERLELELQDRLVALSKPLPWEVQLLDIERYLDLRGARLCYPRMQGDSLEWIQVADCSDQSAFSKNTSGIWEPNRGQVIDFQEIALILVPGVAFDFFGARIGMGKGFYDRFLPQVPNAIRLSVGFGFQLSWRLPQENWDQKVDWLMTETSEWVLPTLRRKWIRP